MSSNALEKFACSSFASSCQLDPLWHRSKTGLRPRWVWWEIQIDMRPPSITLFEIEYRNSPLLMKEADREILLGFWKVHILHHAGEEPIHGQWVLKELRRHGYEISPGTLYPLLERMERRGWLRGRRHPGAGLRGRKDYTLTKSGRQVLGLVREQVKELYRELVLEAADAKPGEKP